MSKRKAPSIKTLLAVIFFSLLLLLAYFGYKVVGSNTGNFKKETYLYIPTGAIYSQVLDSLDRHHFIKDKSWFHRIARLLKYPDGVKAGKYEIKPGMSNLAILRMLRNGKQQPVKLVINKLRTKQDFLQKVSEELEPEKETFEKKLNDSVFLFQYNLQPENSLCLILPDTYEFYWNTTAEKALTKIAKNYTRFWSSEKKAAAQQLGLTPQEVIILASIVEEETNKTDEMGAVASTYLNRLRTGMKLQADPTARFAFGDFTIKRITSKQTSFPSPYNTYYVSGLPPGPICTPSKNTLNEVLNAPKTAYLYFCAKEDFSGYHNFAATYAEHLKNARRYQQALNERGVR